MGGTGHLPVPVGGSPTETECDGLKSSVKHLQNSNQRKSACGQALGAVPLILNACFGGASCH